MVKKIEKNPLLGNEPVDTGKPSEAKVETPKAKQDFSEIKDEAERTKAILATKPHTNFIIPLGEGEAEGSTESVNINGYQLTIQKGVMVNIPMAVANILAEKYRIAMTAGSEKRIDRTSDVSEALG